MLKKNILIVGCSRNNAATLANEIDILEKAFKDSGNLYWLIIESDSIDNSIEVLKKISRNKTNFNYINAGALESRFTSRTQRLAYCRNLYLEELFSNPTFKDCEYLVVSDLDNNNRLLTKEGIESCWRIPNWDCLTANQRGPYFDIWALRHPAWNPGDCWEQYRFLTAHHVNPEFAQLSSVYSKMIFIQENHSPIAVESAFGGLGIYKKNALENCRYIGSNEDGNEVCEHVSLHLQMRERGFSKIFVNPKLINTDFTNHSETLREAFRST